MKFFNMDIMSIFNRTTGLVAKMTREQQEDDNNLVTEVLCILAKLLFVACDAFI